MAFFLFQNFMPALKIRLFSCLFEIFGFHHLLSFLASAVLQAGVLGFVIPPCPVTGEVREQVLPHIFVFRPDKAQPQQEGAEGKGRVFADLGFPHDGPALVDCLCGNRQRQRDICPNLTGMEGAFKTAPFQGAAIEHRMQVQSVIPRPVTPLYLERLKLTRLRNSSIYLYICRKLLQFRQREKRVVNAKKRSSQPEKSGEDSAVTDFAAVCCLGIYGKTVFRILLQKARKPA